MESTEHFVVNHIQYHRDTTTENILNLGVTQTMEDIREIMKTKSKSTDLSDFYHNTFNPFLRATANMMMDTTNTHQLQLHENGQAQFKHIDPKNLASMTTSSSIKIVNILCFGKSLYYLLKYIEYMNNSSTDLVFFLFSDADSYELYKNSEPLATTIVNENMAPLFCNKINDDYSINARLISQIPIYFVHGSHDLIRGVGGKRALIQHYNYTYLSGHNKKYSCMTIDDNITDIIELNGSCTAKITQKISRPCGEHPSCRIVFLSEIYDILRHKLDEDCFFAGIDKGDATATDQTKSSKTIQPWLKHSGAIYKLNVCLPVRLYDHEFYYNPYMSRFLEDVTFNCIVSKYSIKSNRYHLRFGHPMSNDAGIEDYDHVFLNKKYTTTTTVAAIQPIYNMYLLHYLCLIDIGTLTLDYITEKTKPVIPVFKCSNYILLGLPKRSKYRKYGFVLYFAMVLLCLKHNIFDTSVFTSTKSGGVFFSFKDMNIFTTKTINNFNVSYQLTSHFPIRAFNDSIKSIYRGKIVGGHMNSEKNFEEYIIRNNKKIQFTNAPLPGTQLANYTRGQYRQLLQTRKLSKTKSKTKSKAKSKTKSKTKTKTQSKRTMSPKKKYTGPRRQISISPPIQRHKRLPPITPPALVSPIRYKRAKYNNNGDNYW